MQAMTYYCKHYITSKSVYFQEITITEGFTCSSHTLQYPNLKGGGAVLIPNPPPPQFKVLVKKKRKEKPQEGLCPLNSALFCSRGNGKRGLKTRPPPGLQPIRMLQEARHVLMNPAYASATQRRQKVHASMKNSHKSNRIKTLCDNFLKAMLITLKINTVSKICYISTYKTSLESITFSYGS